MSNGGLHDGAWIAVQVRAGCERIVRDGLNDRGYEEFLPLYKSQRLEGRSQSVVDRTLFPGYIFCRYIRCPTFRICEIPHVIRLVGISNVPLRIPDEEIESIRVVVNSGLYSEPWKFLQTGQTVIVNRGALRGLCGRLVSVRNGVRFVISVELLGRAVAVEIDAADVSPVNEAESVGIPQKIQLAAC